MWLLYTVAYQNRLDLGFLGVKPRTLAGIPTILSAPLVHSDWWHLVSNSIPVLFLGTSLFFFYEPIGRKVFWRCYLIPYVLVWLFGVTSAYHLGASGLVYGLAVFLIIFGFLKRDIASVFLSLAVVILYGGIFFSGLIPGKPGISWETHLAGVLIGLWSAIEFHLKDKRFD